MLKNEIPISFVFCLFWKLCKKHRFLLSFSSTDFKYETDEYIETIQTETESIDKSSIGPQILCINSDGAEYAHQIEVDDYQEDQLEEDALDTPQYEQRLISTSVNNKGPFKESSSVYYISAPPSTSTTATDSQPQSSQRQTKMVSNATIAQHNNDPDARFLLSCLPALKRLPNRKNAYARVKIQQLLFEIEFDEYSGMSSQQISSLN